MQGVALHGETVPQTNEEIQQICVHVWRDISEVDGIIIQECIRCKKSRTLSIN